MAPHIYPPIHQNPIFHSFFPTTFSNSIPLHPTHSRITKYFLNEHTINFPPLFPTFQTSFSHFQPANHLPPSVQIFSIPFFNEHTNSPRPPPKKNAPFLMRDDVQKKDYTLELHIEMKAMYENLDKFDFYKWHQEKKNYFKDVLCGYFNYYQRVHHIFIKILLYLQYHAKSLDLLL